LKAPIALFFILSKNIKIYLKNPDAFD